MKLCDAPCTTRRVLWIWFFFSTLARTLITELTTIKDWALLQEKEESVTSTLLLSGIITDYSTTRLGISQLLETPG